MADERCPWCGEGCIFHDRCRIESLTARVTRLESALRTIADTNDPGTLPGDMARDALRAEA